MVQKVLKDMVIIAELWPPAFAAIHTVEFHYAIMQSLRSIVLQLRTVSPRLPHHSHTAEHPWQGAQVQVWDLVINYKCAVRGRNEGRTSSRILL